MFVDFIGGYSSLAATFLVAVAAAGVLTPVAMRWSVAVGLVDHPRPGEVQRTSVPRAGGHAIYIAFIGANCCCGSAAATPCAC